MKILIINKIQNIDFVDESKFKKILDLKNEIKIWENIHWWTVELTKEKFIELLPILNWFINKYWFYDTINLWIDKKLVKLQNIYEIEFDFEKIKEITSFIQEVKNYIESWKLLTKSKKEEILKKVEDYIYLVLQNIIKIYFLILDTQQNQKELEKILSSKNIFEEYKSQANLLKTTSNVNTEKMINQLSFLIKELNIITKYFQKIIESFLNS